jgi:hypothetical protein
MTFFELLTYITIIVSAIVNTFAFYYSSHVVKRRAYKSLMFANIASLSWIWFVIYGMRISDWISVDDYFDLVNPLVPAAFIVVWILPSVLYIVERRGKNEPR